MRGGRQAGRSLALIVTTAVVNVHQPLMGPLVIAGWRDRPERSLTLIAQSLNDGAYGWAVDTSFALHVLAVAQTPGVYPPDHVSPGP
jgi:hypothetical protein